MVWPWGAVTYSGDIVEKLNREIKAGLADIKIKNRLADLGGDPMPMGPAEFGKLVADETEKWGKLIRATNIRLEGGRVDDEVGCWRPLADLGRFGRTCPVTGPC